MSRLLLSDKEVAFCRESKGGAHRARGTRCEGHRVRSTRCGAHGAEYREAGGGGRPRWGAGHGEERTANMSSMSVTLDVSKLSGWLNASAHCREPKEGHTMLSQVRAVRREIAGDGGARSVQGRAQLQIGGRARGGAYPEHGVHGRDAGGVEAQRLVERRRVLEHAVHPCDFGRLEV
eukprot:scaffold22564_cov67-Phaeocystis_antarctica.AAC.1